MISTSPGSNVGSIAQYDLTLGNTANATNTLSSVRHASDAMSTITSTGATWKATTSIMHETISADPPSAVSPLRGPGLTGGESSTALSAVDGLIQAMAAYSPGSGDIVNLAAIDSLHAQPLLAASTH
jgi:hypothetical protein